MTTKIVPSLDKLRESYDKVFPMISQHKITYRYMSSSDQHIFNNYSSGEENVKIHEWCVATFGEAGDFKQDNKQWCRTRQSFVFFTKKEADIFALRWL